jgi:hypothetical protein
VDLRLLIRDVAKVEFVKFGCIQSIRLIKLQTPEFDDVFTTYRVKFSRSLIELSDVVLVKLLVGFLGLVR